ncbi:MAG: CRP-like cAMP-binding protein [Flavobacteriales bacterium]|jgi:CRP-like cAMP-binding protein
MFASKQIVDPLSSLARAAFESAHALVPLKSLRESFLEHLFLNVEVQSVGHGEVIFEHSTYDNQYVFLQAGQVELRFPSGHIERIDAGVSFAALSHYQPRRCKATAISDCTVLRVDEDLLDQTLSWSQMTDFLLSELALDRSFDKEIEWMQTVLNSNLFFKVPSINAEQIFRKMHAVEVQAGDRIIEQDDIGDCCYILTSGWADILKRRDDGSEQKIAEISTGRCFGEDALVNQSVRNASVRMGCDAVLKRLDKSDFLLLAKEPAAEEIDASDLDVPDSEFILLDARTEEEYQQGHLAFSANIPLGLLAMKKRLLSPEKLYVMYCDTGRRSRAAAHFLGKEGYNVIAIKNGLQGQNMTDRLVVEAGYILRNGELVTSGSVE